MKNITQKILKLINNHRMVTLALLLAFIVPSLTQASGGVEVTMVAGTGRSYLVNWYTGHDVTFFRQQDKSGNIYYCMDRGLLGSNINSYSVFHDPTLTLSDMSSKVLALGHPNQSIPGIPDQNDQHYVTQVALWATTTSHNLDMAPSNQYMTFDKIKVNPNSPDKAKSQRILDAAKDLYNRASAASISKNRLASMSGSQVVIKGDQATAGPFTIGGQNIVGASMNLTVSGVNNARIHNAQSQTITKADLGQPFFVSFPRSGNSLSGKLTITASGSKTFMTGLQYAPPTRHHQYLARYGKFTENQNIAHAVNWVFPVVGQAEITKSDLTTAAPVAGATIEIYNASGTKVFGAVTNSQGKVVSPELPAGKYTFKETIAPKGYKLTTEIGVFEIKQNGEIVKAKMTNQRIPDTPVTIVKQDRATQKVLSGAKIEVRDASQKVIFTGDTNSQGVVSVGALKAGEYTYKEVTPPAGYKLNTETYKFSVTPGQAAIRLIITNDLIPIIPDTPVQIVKVDKDTKKPLAGAQIEVYDSKNAKIYTGVTTVDGKVQVGKLKAGEYTYKEVTPPAGYKLNTETYRFTVKVGDATTILTITNEIIPVGKIQITKTDLTTSAPLAGATIEIYDATGKLVYASESDSKGIIETELVAGKYTFKETIAPAGYELSTEVGTFEIKQNGEIVKAEMKNKPLEKEVPVVETPAELPKTGPVEAVAALVGIGSVTLAVAYWHKSNQALKKKTQ